jgi:AraC family transcriptional regulator
MKDEASYRWLSVGRWFLWDGGFLLIGRAKGLVPAHAHHAIQIVVSQDEDLLMWGEDGRLFRGKGIVVKQDVTHSFDCNGALGGMLFVDPESSEGIWLQALLREGITILPEERLVPALQAMREMQVGGLIRRCVQAVSEGTPPARKLDERVTKVLLGIRNSDDLRMTLETAAGMAYLSPSRFAHLFKEQLGLPFSRYLLWRKLTRAMLAIGSEKTIADAAQVADFADAAHLTRTFYQMVGMAPSALMRGEFAEIPSPFEE